MSENNVVYPVIAETEMARNVGKFNDKTIRVTAWNGTAFYCCKCPEPELVEGIYLPEKSRDQTWRRFRSWLRIIAWGRNVGKGRIVINDIRVHDVLLCPTDGPGIIRSPYADDEFFIREDVPIFKHREKQ